MNNENNEPANLISQFSEENDYHAKTKILHSLIQEYIEYSKDDLETSIKTVEFLEILSQIPNLCFKFLHVSETTSLNDISSTSNLHSKSLNLESASLCFDDVIVCLDAFFFG